MSPADDLRQELRRLAVRVGPGVTLSQLCQETGVAPSTVRHVCGSWTRLRVAVRLPPRWCRLDADLWRLRQRRRTRDTHCVMAAVAWNSETPNELWLGQRSEANRMLLKDPSLLSPAARKSADYPGGHNEGFPDTFKQLFQTFYAAIRTGDRTAATAYPTFAHVHREIVLCEAILRSHRERQWVDVIRD